MSETFSEPLAGNKWLGIRNVEFNSLIVSIASIHDCISTSSKPDRECFGYFDLLQRCDIVFGSANH